LSEIKEASGATIDADLLEKLDSDNDFDAETWDAKISEAFNDDYYQASRLPFLSLINSFRMRTTSTKAPISSTDKKEGRLRYWEPWLLRFAD